MRWFKNSLLRAACSNLSSSILVCATIGFSAWAMNSVYADTPPCAPAKLAFASNRDGDYDIYLMEDVCNPTSTIQITVNSASDYSPDLSPDGSRILFASNLDGDWDVYVTNTDGSNVINLTNNSADDLYPAWSPDGSQIAFTTNRDRNWDVYVMNADGSNPIRLTYALEFEGNPTWSPDGQQIAYVRGLDNDRDIWLMDASGENQQPLITNRWAQYSPAWSPDGAYIAYVSNQTNPNLPLEGGTYYPHIHLADPTCTQDDNNWLECSRPLPSATTDTELDPAWLPDGSRLVYGSVLIDNTDLFMIDVSAVDGTTAIQLTDDPADDRFPG